MANLPTGRDRPTKVDLKQDKITIDLTVYQLLIVDDHALLRDALAGSLANHYQDADIQQADSLKACTELLRQGYDPDLIVYDLNLTDHQGASGINIIRDVNADIPVLVISAEKDKQTILACLSAGAAGFALKANPKEDFLHAVEQVLAGQIYFPDMHQQQATTEKQISRDTLASLTQKQLQVLALIAEGHANKEICHRLCIAETTVKTHVSDILRKLEVKNRTKAALAVDRATIEQLLQN